MEGYFVLRKKTLSTLVQCFLLREINTQIGFIKENKKKVSSKCDTMQTRGLNLGSRLDWMDE